MATERSSAKTDATAPKPAPTPRTPLPRPEIRSPLLDDGPELVRDSHT